MFIYVYIYRLIKEIYKIYFGYCFALTMARKKFKKTYRPKLPTKFNVTRVPKTETFKHFLQYQDHNKRYFSGYFSSNLLF